MTVKGRVTVHVLLCGAVRPVGLVIRHGGVQLMLESSRRLLIRAYLCLERGELFVEVRIRVPRHLGRDEVQAARDQHSQPSHRCERAVAKVERPSQRPTRVSRQSTQGLAGK